MDGSGRCALHPKRRAVGTCTRCGNHACAKCWERNDALCVGCAPDHGSYRVPWESTAWIGFPRTIGDALLSPMEFFGRAGPPRSFVRPLELALVVWVVVVLTLSITGTVLQGGDLASLVPNLPILTGLAAALGVVIALAQGTLIWMLGKIARREMGLGAAVRAAAYGQASQLLLPLIACFVTPLGQPTASLAIGTGTLVVWLHQSVAFGSFVRGRAGPFVRAYVVGGLVAGAWVVLLFVFGLGAGTV